MNANWHPDCFRCEICNKRLADVGFLRNGGRALCRECNEIEKEAGSGRYVCHKCKAIIEEGGHIKYQGDSFHPYHFKCARCSNELTIDAREVNGELYCLRCHDTMGIPICGACHRPIEERVVTALGKNWHVEVVPLDLFCLLIQILFRVILEVVKCSDQSQLCAVMSRSDHVSLIQLLYCYIHDDIVMIA
ncbi:unnamed protein product [Anisakis simplex]|uniref:AT21926p (inferred by orthology to a D. melanogaster protein) n=2 Tax=Anisakis simplex TaxID=6269 RepID=A0A0M3JBB0_ANISI|nr:unnamed protein product [Anisakis simplex]